MGAATKLTTITALVLLFAGDPDSASAQGDPTGWTITVDLDPTTTNYDIPTQMKYRGFNITNGPNGTTTTYGPWKTSTATAVPFAPPMAPQPSEYRAVHGLDPGPTWANVEVKRRVAGGVQTDTIQADVWVYDNDNNNAPVTPFSYSVNPEE